MVSEGLDRTDYSFVPSSLGESCFGFDPLIVIVVGRICSNLCHVRIIIYRVHYAMDSGLSLEKMESKGCNSTVSVLVKCAAKLKHEFLVQRSRNAPRVLR